MRHIYISEAWFRGVDPLTLVESGSNLSNPKG